MTSYLCSQFTWGRASVYLSLITRGRYLLLGQRNKYEGKPGNVSSFVKQKHVFKSKSLGISNGIQMATCIEMQLSARHGIKYDIKISLRITYRVPVDKISMKMWLNLLDKWLIGGPIMHSIGIINSYMDAGLTDYIRIMRGLFHEWANGYSSSVYITLF